MACSPGMSQALARLPGLFVSTVLTCMVGALLQPLPGLTLFVGGLGVTVVLCAGGLERPAVRLLGRARVLSDVEAAALAPAIALLCHKGLGPPAVELYARDGAVGISAGAAGRRSVVVSAGLVQAVQLGQLPADQAAGVIAAAVGRIRLGQTRFDVAVEFWTIPWQLVRAVCLTIAKTVGWLPLTRFAWRIRFVVTVVAVAQSVADDPDRRRIGGGRLHRADVPGPAVATPVGLALTGRLRPVRGRPRARGALSASSFAGARPRRGHSSASPA